MKENKSQILTYKNSKELTSVETNKMYNIIISNLKILFPNFIEKDSDYEIWINNIINEPNCNFILAYSKSEICGYIEYIKTDLGYHICEFQIDNEHKKDNKTFLELMIKLSRIINLSENDIVTCKINEDNKNSISVFTGIGFNKKENKKYEIDGKGLLDWINLKKKNNLI